MRIKSYFADSVQDAIEKARVELGPDAMLMNSKKTDFELRALGSVEVVFGLPGQTASSKSRLQTNAPGFPTQEAPSKDANAGDAASASPQVAQELADLRRQIETVKRSMSRQHQSGSGSDERHSRTSENLCTRLIAAGIGEDLAQEIAEAVDLHTLAWKQSSSSGPRGFENVPPDMLESAVKAELERRFQVSAELGVPGTKQKIVMFVGPAGAGKTTSLIKLGFRCGLQARLPMHILSLDTLRVGGWEQLAAYARIGGLGFDAVHNLATLELLLVQHSDKKLILIDTPGFSASDMDDLNDLAGWTKRFSSIDIQLVLPSTLRSSVFGRAVDRFSVIKPAKLLLTRIDEVEPKGILLDLAIRAQLPLSYLSNGQTIPEDISQASKGDLLTCLTDRIKGDTKQEAA